MTIEFTPRGVCSRHMTISAEEGLITDVEIDGGCSGNLQGLSKLLPGMRVSEAIEKLSGIDCGGKGTSCPDQISIALRQLQD